MVVTSIWHRLLKVGRLVASPAVAFTCASLGEAQLLDCAHEGIWQGPHVRGPLGG